MIREVVAMLLLGHAAARSAQTDQSQRLAHVTAVSCAFKTKATAEWSKDTGETQGTVSRADFTIGFDQIDTDGATARAIGAFGPSEIIVRFSNGNLHLLQSFNEGQLYVTTIFPEATPRGEFKAVHTRHEFTVVSLPGFTSRPEQYYGTCTAK